MTKTALFFVGVFAVSFIGMLFVTGVFREQILPLWRGELPLAVEGQILEEKLRQFDPDSALVVLQAIKTERTGIAAEKDSLESLRVLVSMKVEELRSEASTLAELRAAPADTKIPGDVDQEAAFGVLAKLYSAMKPQEAAEVINELDDKTVVQLLSKMKDRQAAALMELIDANRAAKLSKLMAFGLQRES
jgi:flagellar motility protein MotE (MotC chaperone)